MPAADPTPTRQRLTRGAFGLAVIGLGLATALWWTAPPHGLTREVFEGGLGGRLLDARTVSALDGEPQRAAGVPDGAVGIRWSGYWAVVAPGVHQVLLRADGEATFEIEHQGRTQQVVSRGLDTPPAAVLLEPGLHRLQLTYERATEPSVLRFGVAAPGRSARPLDAASLYPSVPGPGLQSRQRIGRLAWWLTLLAWLAWAAALVWPRMQSAWRPDAGEAAGWRASLARLRRSVDATPARTRRIVTVVVLLAVIAVAALLRADALLRKYGPLTSPAWVSSTQGAVLDAAGVLRPDALRWNREPAPYVGGDPINYLKFAREMRSFYQAHVREPVFLAATRAWLVLLDGQDVAVSFASATFSLLLVPATFLLGRAVFGTPAGLIAAALMAIEVDAISWGVDGWRDDASALFIALTTWSLIRLSTTPRRKTAVVGGVLGAAAALTRITSLGLWLPGLALAASIGAGATRARRWRMALLNLAVGLALVSPYLYNCYAEFGDPLEAVNAHTTFYRAREHVAYDTPMSARQYVLGKLRDQPAQTLDTSLYGILVYPFAGKWTGFDWWWRGAGRALAWASALGLLLSACTPSGRLMLACLAFSLVPFAVTWNVTGGGEWRFTLPAYPVYLAACGFAMAASVRVAADTLSEGVRRAWQARLRARAACLSTVAVTTVVVWLALMALPWAALRGSLAGGHALEIRPATRQDVVLSKGWLIPEFGGCASATGGEQTLKLPLSGPGAWRLDLHLASDQPASAGPQPLEVVVEGARRTQTVVMRPDDRNQVATIRIARADAWFTDVSLVPMGGGAGSATRRTPEYSLCRVDISPEE